MLAASVLWATLLALAGQAVAPGTPIVAITVIRHDVFDLDEPGTSAWPYRAANAVHIVSREAFIRSLLLVHVGDVLDPALLAESERALRATGFLSPVTITTRPAPGGAEVVIETRDQFTTEAAVNFGLAGNQHRLGFSLTEKNSLGLGKEVELSWRSDPERNTLTAAYYDPLLFGSRWTLAAGHADASDGKGDLLDIVLPFYALGTLRAGGVEWQRASMTDYLWAQGEKRVAGQVFRRSLRLWGGMRVARRPASTDRITAGFFAEEASFTEWSNVDGSPYDTPEDRDLAGVEVGYEHQADRWRVIQGLRAWSRQEDVPLGPSWHVSLGASLPALGGDADRLRFASDLTLGTLQGRWYSWLVVKVAGRLDRGAAANTVLHLEAGTARIGAQGLRARIATDVGRNLDRDFQLTLGADVGLRGWDPSTFDGTSRAVANLEYRRRLTGEVLHLGIIGMTVFADTGRTWSPRIGPGTDGMRFDVGAGLAMEITRAAILRIVRAEVGFPDDGSGPLFLITGVSLF